MTSSREHLKWLAKKTTEALAEAQQPGKGLEGMLKLLTTTAVLAIATAEALQAQEPHHDQ
jgi:hypothetical protein